MGEISFLRWYMIQINQCCSWRSKTWNYLCLLLWEIVSSKRFISWLEKILFKPRQTAIFLLSSLRRQLYNSLLLLLISLPKCPQILFLYKKSNWNSTKYNKKSTIIGKVFPHLSFPHFVTLRPQIMFLMAHLWESNTQYSVVELNFNF